MLAESTDALCSQFINVADAALHDCVTDDLALMLAAAGVDDVRAVLGAEWRFDPADGSGLPELSLPPSDQAGLVTGRTGLRLVESTLTSAAAELGVWRELLAAARPILVVADAYALPWVPYAGHEHMSHGFVVDGIAEVADPAHPGDTVLHVSDPYDNATQWGRAEPTETTIRVADLDEALRGPLPGRWGVLVGESSGRGVDAAACLAANAESMARAEREGTFERFAAAHREVTEQSVENLTMQAWLAARSRGLHALWLRDRAAEGGAPAATAAALADRFDEEILPAWGRVTETSYVASRRLRSGRAAPTAHVEALEAALDTERRVAADLADRTAGRVELVGVAGSGGVP